DSLHPLAARLYSVANHVRDGRVELCVATTRYALDGIEVEGVASTWLAHRLAPGASVRWYPVRNPAFRLPEDTRPLLLIGPGTGVAPFRGYLQQLVAGAPPRDVWLFFGHRTRAHDDLYGDEFAKLIATGQLARFDAVWSRDGVHREVVQDRVRSRSDEIWSWLERGARVRVCGDASGMAPGVRAAFTDVASEHGVDGPAWLDSRRASGDYLEDVY
ncbi:MAG: hypothetical protein AAF602_30765, partial [Myxococcota bacterium]